MFCECSLLSSLPDISKWDTSNVTNMSGMFNACESLSSLPDISKWNTSNVTNMSGMFDECSSLHETKSLSYLPSKIFIKTIKGKTIFVYYIYDDTIKNIKNKIKIKENIPSELQLLFFNEQQLEDDKTLKYYNIENLSTLHLVLKKK